MPIAVVALAAAVGAAWWLAIEPETTPAPAVPASVQPSADATASVARRAPENALRTEPEPTASAALLVAVRTSDGRPVAGAAVEAFLLPEEDRSHQDFSRHFAPAGTAPAPTLRASAGADGVAAFARLDAGTWLVAAAAPGLGRECVQFVRERGETEPQRLDVHLRPAARLAGRVLDETGSGVVGAKVIASPPSTSHGPADARRRREAATDSGGAYAFIDLAPGVTELWCSVGSADLVFGAPVIVPDVERFDFHVKAAVRGGCVRGTVTDIETGAPVGGVQIRVTDSPFAGTGATVAEAISDAAGRYEAWTGQAKCRIHGLEIEKPGYLLARSGADPRISFMGLLDGRTVVWDVKVREAATVAGVVTGPEGPVAGASVDLHFATDETFELPTRDPHTTTAADGSYRFVGLRSGPAVVLVTADGLLVAGVAPDEQQSRMTFGGTSSDETLAELPEATRILIPPRGTAVRDVRMERAPEKAPAATVTVRGFVRNEAGTAVSGALVRDGAETPTPRTKSADDGSFTLEGVPVADGKAGVVAQAHGYRAAYEELTLDVGASSSTVSLTLVRRPMLSGLVRGPGGVAVVGATVDRYGFDAREDGAPGMVHAGASRSTSTDAKGRFELDLDVPSGQGTIVLVSAPGFESQWSAPVKPVEGRFDSTADVTLDAGIDVEARVVAAGTTAGIEGVGVMLHRRPPWSEGRGGFEHEAVSEEGLPRLPLSAVSGAGGRLVLRHLLVGEYDVCLVGHGLVRKFASLSVPPEGEKVFEIGAALDIAGQVLLDDGTPVPGVTVWPSRTDGVELPKAPSGAVPRAPTNDAGAFVVHGLPAGTYELYVSASSAGDTGTCAAKLDSVEAGATGLRIVVARGALVRGRVVGPDGAVPASAQVQAGSQSKDKPSSCQVDVEPDGTFVLKPLAAAPHWVVAYAPGLAYVVVRDVTPGGEPIALTLATGLAVEGVLVDEAGKPVAEQRLELQLAESDGPWSRQSVTTSADGTFRAAGLVKGRYRITLSSRSWGLRVGRGPTRTFDLEKVHVDAGESGVTLRGKWSRPPDGSRDQEEDK